MMYFANISDFSIFVGTTVAMQQSRNSVGAGVARPDVIWAEQRNEDEISSVYIYIDVAIYCKSTVEQSTEYP
jgi:hypothetical protein